MEIVSKSSGDELTADEFNQLPGELQNIIQSYGIALAANDVKQVQKALANLAAVGNYYTDSGSSTAYVLDRLDTSNGDEVTQQEATIMVKGMAVYFEAGNTSSSTEPTLEISGLSPYPILNARGNTLKVGSILTGIIYGVRFNGTAWLLQEASGGSGDNYYQAIATGVNSSLELTAGPNTPFATAYTDGMVVRWRAPESNEGPIPPGILTIDVDGLGPKELQNSRSFGDVPSTVALTRIQTRQFAVNQQLSAWFNAAEDVFVISQPVSSTSSLDDAGGVLLAKASGVKAAYDASRDWATGAYEQSSIVQLVDSNKANVCKIRNASDTTPGGFFEAIKITGSDRYAISLKAYVQQNTTNPPQSVEVGLRVRRVTGSSATVRGHFTVVNGNGLTALCFSDTGYLDEQSSAPAPRDYDFSEVVALSPTAQNESRGQGTIEYNVTLFSSDDTNEYDIEAFTTANGGVSIIRWSFDLEVARLANF